MFGKKQEMMMYVIMGFLEAGKTSLIRDLLEDELFDDRSKTLILACEEGEEEYPQSLLDKTHAVCEYIEDEESFCGDVVKKFLKKHRPDRIIVEYNGMWPTAHIPELYQSLAEICFDREVYLQTIDVVNDETFALYTKNMPSMMVDQYRMAEMIIVNRCTVEKTNKNAVRGSVKAVNPRAQIVYESQDDAFYDLKEEMPFDVNADVITISDDDFGLWYVDMIDNEQVYSGKTIRIKGMVQFAAGLGKEYIVFGRQAMTCCADDIQFLGFLCKGDDWSDYHSRDYITITARLEFEYRKEYGEEGPVFYADSVEKAEKPTEEIVYFN
jgi:hypothetical protein